MSSSDEESRMEASASAPKLHRCIPCKKSYKTKKGYDDHMKSNDHKKVFKKKGLHVGKYICKLENVLLAFRVTLPSIVNRHAPSIVIVYLTTWIIGCR